MMNVPCMYILLDKIIPWLYLMMYHYGFLNGLINEKNPRNHESYVIIYTS